MNQAARADAVQLYAAGSLRAALTDVSKAFRAVSGVAVQGEYGPSGILEDEIARGAKADVFASANMTHPQTLAETGKSGPVVLFARNRLCALVRPGLGVTTANLLDRMLEPEVKLGTSTPKADPSGDYAFEVFGKAEGLRRGARAALQDKALQPQSPSVARDIMLQAGYLARLAVPLLAADRIVGAVVVRRKAPGEFRKNRAVADLRRAIRTRHPERPAVQRDREKKPATRNCKQAQITVRRQHEP